MTRQEIEKQFRLTTVAMFSACNCDIVNNGHILKRVLNLNEIINLLASLGKIFDITFKNGDALRLHDKGMVIDYIAEQLHISLEPPQEREEPMSYEEYASRRK